MDDPWLNPLLVANRRLRFDHGPEDVAAARAFSGPIEAQDAPGLARAIVARVHERMRVRPSAFSLGMPKSLRGIVNAGGGNCVAHSVLAVVLLREHGIPARLVGENVYTNVSMLRAPAALLRAPIGPTLNGHVWLEAKVGGEWTPADAELGVWGQDEWFAARLAHGADLRALGFPIAEHWKFPLRVWRVGSDGQPAEDVTRLYLVDRLAEALGGVALPEAWVDGVTYFSQSFRWDGRPGLRLLGEQHRLSAMSLALATVAGGLSARA